MVFFGFGFHAAQDVIVAEKNMGDFMIQKPANQFDEFAWKGCRKGWQNDFFSSGITIVAVK